jgi:hypothetical protein
MYKFLIASIFSLVLPDAWASGPSLGLSGGFLILGFLIFLLSIFCSAIILLTNAGVRSISGFIRYAWRIFLVSFLLSGAWIGFLLALENVMSGIAFWSLPGSLICFIVAVVKTTAGAEKEKRSLIAEKS